MTGFLIVCLWYLALLDVCFWATTWDFNLEVRKKFVHCNGTCAFMPLFVFLSSFFTHVSFGCRNTRETTPCSLIKNSEMISTPGSTTKSKISSSMTSRRRMESSVCRFIPNSLEMEEFFAAAEQHEQHTFREKYVWLPSLWLKHSVNFCIGWHWTAILFWSGITSVLWTTALFLDGMNGRG